MDWFRRILDRYGQETILRTAEGETAVRAFLQPVPERDEQVPETYPSIGWLDGRLWRYLGLAAVDTGDVLVWNDMEFRVRSGRPYYIGETLSHWRAVLERKREAEPVCGN